MNFSISSSSPAEQSWAKTRRQLERLTNEELQSLLVSDDTYMLDYLIDQKPIIKRLQCERAEMRKQVLSSAVANYAREPEFARDRLKLRAQVEDLAHMICNLEKNRFKPVALALEQLHVIQNKLSGYVSELDEQSERMAKEFLRNGANKFDEASCPATTADLSNSATCEPVSTSPYEHFIREYEHLRKAYHKKRILADRLGQERDALLSRFGGGRLL